MKRDVLLACVVAAGAMCGLAGCDPSSQTALPDPNVDGVSAKTRPVDMTIMDDQSKLYQERKAAMERAIAPAPVPAATAPATGTGDVAATGTATTTAPTENTAPPTPDATTAPAPTDPPR